MSVSRRLLPSTAALAAFDSVARLGSFTDAADELSLTQSAVSRQIGALEDQVGQKLFHRTSRQVSLTPQGREYAEAIDGALQAIRQATIRLMTGRETGMLSLSVLPTFGTRWLMPRLPRFLDRNPGVTLDMVCRIGFFDLAAENVDVAIQNGIPEWPGGRCTQLMDEQLLPVVSPELRAAAAIEDPGDLADVPLLHLMTRRTAWAAWFRMQGLTAPRQAGMRFEQFSTATQACLGGLGAGLMPEILIRPEIERGDLVVVGPAMTSETCYFLVETAGQSSDAVTAFRSWLVEEIALEAGEGG